MGRCERPVCSGVSSPSARRRHGCRLPSPEYERIDSGSSVRATGDPNGRCDDGLLSGYPLACFARSLAPPVHLPGPGAASRSHRTLPELVISAADGRRRPPLAHQGAIEPASCWSVAPSVESSCLTLVSVVSPVSCRGLQRSGPVRPPTADDGPSLSLYALL